MHVYTNLLFIIHIFHSFLLSTQHNNPHQRPNQMQSQINYSTVIALLKALQTDQVNKAEQELMEIAKRPQFMEIIFMVIKSQTEDEWIKTLASTFLNRVLCDNISQISYSSLFTAITNILSSYEIKSLDKRCFQRSIISSMELMQQNRQMEWRDFIWRTLKDPQLLDTAFLLIACTAIAQIHSGYISIIVMEMFEHSFKASGQISVQNAMLINQLIKTWIVVWDRLLVLRKDQKGEQLQQINSAMSLLARSQDLADFIQKIYYFNCAKQSELLICVQPGLQQLNLLKYEAAQLNRRVAEYSYQTNTQSKSLAIIKNNFYAIRNTLGAIGMQLHKNSIQKFQCQDLIICLMSLSIIYVKAYSKFIQFNEANIIQHIICFQFLITREDQMVMFEQSPVEFNSLVEDCCDKQTYGILKTQAAKLLQTLGDIFPITVQSAIKMCIESIKIKLGFSQNPYQNSPVKILDLEVAFQVLSIFSYNLQNYPRHLADLKIILLDKRTFELNPFEMTKVFLFLAYNYGEVFPNRQEGAIWVQIALNYHTHPTSRYFGLDFLSNIADQFYSSQFLVQIGKLIKLPKVGETGQVWAMINKIVDNQKNKISEQELIKIVNIIYDRIQVELKQLQTYQKETTLDIINSLHVLRKIIQDKQYCKNKITLKERIFNVTAMYPQAVKLNIQDEIVKIINEYLKEQAIPQSIYNILGALMKQFGADGYCDKSYMICFNQIIIKSGINRIKDIQRLLLTGLIYHLNDMTKEAKKTKQKFAIGNILILLENLLSVHGFQIANTDQNYLFQIGSMCIRLFPQQQQKIFSKGLLARGLNLLLLCHLYVKFDDTFNYLLKYAQKDIFQGYDAFVLVKLLSKAILGQDNADIIIQLINLMVNVWNSNKNEEQNKKNQKSKKVTKKKLLIKRNQDLDKILQKISNPFTTIRPSPANKSNVYLTPLKDTIKSTLFQMKASNVDTYQLIMLNLSEEMRAKLNFMMTNVELEGGKARIIRKIVGLKQVEQSNTSYITQSIKKQKSEMSNQNIDEEVRSQDQNQVNQFKRRRILRKKQKNKKFIHEQ